MTQRFSLDLRVRVAAFVEAGHSCRAAARHFGVSDSCAIKLMQCLRQSGSLTPARQGRPPGGGKLVAYESFLIQTVEAEPAITMPELAARLLDEHGAVAPPAMLSCFGNSHLPFRQRERVMRAFRSPGGLPRLVSLSALRNLFVPPRSHRPALAIHLHRLIAIGRWITDPSPHSVHSDRFQSE